MPNHRMTDLTRVVQDNLPEHVQEIYQEAFNNAWQAYADNDDRRDDTSREETAHRVAWAAVKQSYRRNSRTVR